MTPAMMVPLMSAPVRLTATGKQELRLAANVSQYNQLDLVLNIYEGTDVVVRILTGMQTETEDGWQVLDTFATTSATFSTKKSFTNPLAFIRWEVTTGGNKTFLITGVARMT